VSPDTEERAKRADEQSDEAADSEQFGIERFRVYRKTHKITPQILGVTHSAIEHAIADGTLPPPVPLTAYGKATGWYGFQLIQVIKDRLSKAEARAAAPPHRELCRRKKNKKPKGARP
jgi:predicted DNA-binding transcriptional regulator AlpA